MGNYQPSGTIDNVKTGIKPTIAQTNYYFFQSEITNRYPTFNWNKWLQQNTPHSGVDALLPVVGVLTRWRKCTGCAYRE